MREGDFEVVLQLLNDERGIEVVTLDEKQIGKKTYAVAEPDNEYIVKVTVHRNALQNFAAKHIRIGVYIDGVDCNYWKRIDTDNVKASACTTFKGYKTGANELRAFMFASPRVMSNVDMGPDAGSSSPGSVRVEIFECVSDEGIFMNRSKNFSSPAGSLVGQDSKFFRRPSVTTTSGRNVNNLEKFNPLVRWKNKVKLGSFVLHYHTREVIDFLADAPLELQTQTSCGRKRATSTSHVVVDLTDENDGNSVVKRLATAAQDDRRLCDGDVNEDDSDDDIQHVPTVKHIPWLDMSQEVEQQVSFVAKHC